MKIQLHSTKKVLCLGLAPIILNQGQATHSVSTGNAAVRCLRFVKGKKPHAILHVPALTFTQRYLTYPQEKSFFSSFSSLSYSRFSFLINSQLHCFLHLPCGESQNNATLVLGACSRSLDKI